jgi:hypothetical protein
MRSMSSASTWVVTSWAAMISRPSSSLKRLRTSMVLPVPIPPVMTMNPSPCSRP